ncbi:hypothetical protein ACFY93_05120 [Streptomyces sp. NPDC008313]|uniref:hypothetical protein n=1 Tax=Streptomyces sp. NPDC008313 TaxID=3364826 RepID=UPI0036E4EFA8
MVGPETLAGQVDIADALGAAPGREPAWISFTVPQDRGDEAYFAPLAGLRAGPGTELYLSLVSYHPDKQARGTAEAQAALIDRFLPGDGRPWGICTECVMARAERADVPRLIGLHREILQRLATAG